MSQGLKPQIFRRVDVRAEARTYLRSNGKNKQQQEQNTGVLRSVRKERELGRDESLVMRKRSRSLRDDRQKCKGEDSGKCEWNSKGKSECNASARTSASATTDTGVSPLRPQRAGLG